MDPKYINRSIESDFEPDDAPTLAEPDPYSPNRTTISAMKSGDTSYQALVERVQYGTYRNQRACLLVFTFLFRFKDKSLYRFESTLIRIRFRRVPNSCSLPLDEKTDEELDEHERLCPHILQLVPALFYGAASEKKIETSKKLEGSIGTQVPGVPVGGGLKPEVTRSTTRTQEVRMTIKGEILSGKKNSDVSEIASWKITENDVQRDGVPPRFQTAVVLRWPASGDPVLANVSVRPQVASFAYPVWRVRQHPLRTDPIGFDGKTPRGQPVNPGKDFADETFDWAAVIKDPTEYRNQLLLV